MTAIQLYDTTLRDGSQQQGISFSVKDKLEITKLLDNLGIDLIEGGWPGSNPKDMEFFARAAKLKLSHARLAAFGSTCRVGKAASQDVNLRALLESQAPVVTIFGKTSTLHIEKILRATQKEGLRIIKESLKFLKSSGRTVFFDAEHFFDGYRLEANFALTCLREAEDAGVDAIILCDTNGGTMPWEVGEIVSRVTKVVKIPLGIHAHNDAGLAAANSLAAVRAGCLQVQGTMNGYGERTGNANLCSLIPTLKVKMGLQLAANLASLVATSHAIAAIANQPLPAKSPYVGTQAFTHKGGIHVSALSRDKTSYEHMDPALVGNASNVVISDLAGKSNIVYKLKAFGLHEPVDDDKLAKVLQELKQWENEGLSYEGADASFELFLRRRLFGHKAPFQLVKFISLVEQDRGSNIEAVVKIRVGKAIMHTAAAGNGPVNALDGALRKALEPFYPQLKHVELTDYKVRIIDPASATEAKTRVMITSSDSMKEWVTVGASTNIIEASWLALSDAVEYALVKK